MSNRLSRLSCFLVATVLMGFASLPAASQGFDSRSLGGLIGILGGAIQSGILADQQRRHFQQKPMAVPEEVYRRSQQHNSMNSRRGEDIDVAAYWSDGLGLDTPWTLGMMNGSFNCVSSKKFPGFTSCSRPRNASDPLNTAVYINGKSRLASFVRYSDHLILSKTGLDAIVASVNVHLGSSPHILLASKGMSGAYSAVLTWGPISLGLASADAFAQIEKGKRALDGIYIRLYPESQRSGTPPIYQVLSGRGFYMLASLDDRGRSSLSFGGYSDASFDLQPPVVASATPSNTTPFVVLSQPQDPQSTSTNVTDTSSKTKLPLSPTNAQTAVPSAPTASADRPAPFETPVGAQPFSVEHNANMPDFQKEALAKDRGTSKEAGISDDERDRRQQLEVDAAAAAYARERRSSAITSTTTGTQSTHAQSDAASQVEVSEPEELKAHSDCIQVHVLYKHLSEGDHVNFEKVIQRFNCYNKPNVYFHFQDTGAAGDLYDESVIKIDKYIDFYDIDRVKGDANQKILNLYVILSSRNIAELKCRYLVDGADPHNLSTVRYWFKETPNGFAQPDMAAIDKDNPLAWIAGAARECPRRDPNHADEEANRHDPQSIESSDQDAPDPNFFKVNDISCNDTNANAEQIGRVPTIPSGAQIAVSTAAGLNAQEVQLNKQRTEYDSLIDDLIKRARLLAQSRSDFNSSIAAARSAFFEAKIGTEERDSAADTLSTLLFAKDIVYLGFYLQEGTTIKAGERARGLMMTGGGDLDDGVQTAGAYTTWVDAMRQALKIPNGGLWIPNPSEYASALRQSMGAYKAYMVERDHAEFSRWREGHPGDASNGALPTPTDVADKIQIYFDDVYDFRAAPSFCSANSHRKWVIDGNRKRVRALILLSEGVRFEPGIVDALLLRRYSYNVMTGRFQQVDIQPNKQLFDNAVRKRLGSGETDLHKITVSSFTEMRDAIVVDSSKPDEVRSEAELSSELDKAVTEGPDVGEVIREMNFSGGTPPYNVIRDEITSGRISRGRW